jgi:hypothetical protein
MMILLATGTSAVADSPAENATVKIYVIRNVSDLNLNISWAENIVSHILAGAEVRIKWQLGEPRRRERDGAIIIDVTSDTPKTLAPGALAYAQVFEGVHIKIFWDRVQNTINGGSRLRTFLLAHVMTHEIVHIIEGIDRHSETGLMKASWTKKEIEEMSVRPLSLAPEDVRLIHIGLLKQATTGLRAGHSGLAHP